MFSWLCQIDFDHSDKKTSTQIKKCNWINGIILLYVVFILKNSIDFKTEHKNETEFCFTFVRYLMSLEIFFSGKKRLNCSGSTDQLYGVMPYLAKHAQFIYNATNIQYAFVATGTRVTRSNSKRITKELLNLLHFFFIWMQKIFR